ncbi:Protein PIN-LIKES 3 [Ranunculus cassubicifolius]
MKLFELFVVSSIPVLKVLLITAVGSILATDYVNLLGEDARKYFNAIVFYVFNPSLIATNLAKTVTLDSIIKLWFMPLNILLTFIIGSAFGWIVIQLTRAPSHLRGLILGCCAAGNLGNMLFIIIPAVCKEKGSPFGAPDVCYTFGMAYASLSMAIVGFIVGVVPQIRKILIGESAPLRVIQDSASLLSEAAIPVLTLIIGGNLLKGLKGGAGIKMSLIVGIIVVRYVLLPISGVLIIKTAIRFGLIHSNPLYQFVLLLQYALPPAMNIGTMTQLFGTGESECSVIMLWTYALASVSLTLWSTLFMWLVS